MAIVVTMTDDEAGLMARLLQDWQARSLKRQTVPPGLTMREWHGQLILADRVIGDLSAQAAKQALGDS